MTVCEFGERNYCDCSCPTFNLVQLGVEDVMSPTLSADNSVLWGLDKQEVTGRIWWMNAPWTQKNYISGNCRGISTNDNGDHIWCYA